MRRPAARVRARRRCGAADPAAGALAQARASRGSTPSSPRERVLRAGGGRAVVVDTFHGSSGLMTRRPPRRGRTAGCSIRRYSESVPARHEALDAPRLRAGEDGRVQHRLLVACGADVAQLRAGGREHRRSRTRSRGPCGSMAGLGGARRDPPRRKPGAAAFDGRPGSDGVRAPGMMTGGGLRAGRDRFFDSTDELKQRDGRRRLRRRRRRRPIEGRGCAS